MITHDEIRDRLKKAYANNRYLNNITICRFLYYIDEQQKKDELINKIKDILALNYSCQEIGIKIKRLFKEEMK